MRNMKFGFEESDEEKDDTNPDWADAIEKSGLGDKLREMNELQLEGADVYMSTFTTQELSILQRYLQLVLSFRQAAIGCDQRVPSSGKRGRKPIGNHPAIGFLLQQR